MRNHFNKKQQLNIAYGLHTLKTILKTSPQTVLEIFVLQDSKHPDLVQLTQQAIGLGISVLPISRKKLEEYSTVTNHQGIAARLQTPKNSYSTADLLTTLATATEPVTLLILDGIQDPHNLGACLRTADAAGVMAVIVPNNNAVGITPVVRKVASGAAETVPLLSVTNLSRTLRELKAAGVWLVGASEHASTAYYQYDVADRSVALVLGAEGTGLRRLTAELCDELVMIPMAGHVSSLNVSVATGVLLYEIVKQRKLFKNSQ